MVQTCHLNRRLSKSPPVRARRPGLAASQPPARVAPSPACRPGKRRPAQQRRRRAAGARGCAGCLRGRGTQVAGAQQGAMDSDGRFPWLKHRPHMPATQAHVVGTAHADAHHSGAHGILLCAARRGSNPTSSPVSSTSRACSAISAASAASSSRGSSRVAGCCSRAERSRPSSASTPPASLRQSREAALKGGKKPGRGAAEQDSCRCQPACMSHAATHTTGHIPARSPDAAGQAAAHATHQLQCPSRLASKRPVSSLRRASQGGHHSGGSTLFIHL